MTIRDGYGQTETTLQVGNFPGQPVKAGSMGRAAPGYQIALLDDDGQEREEGEICVALADKPVAVMPGYLGDAERTANVMRHGHYHTGDVAMRDADGYYTYVGRNDDVFKCSDYRISPFELESLLIEHECVMEAAVVPSPDPQRLAVPKAFVVLRQGFAPTRETALSILRFVRCAQLAVQARAPARIRGPAEDGVGKDSPRRAARVGVAADAGDAAPAGVLGGRLRRIAPGIAAEAGVATRGDDADVCESARYV